MSVYRRYGCGSARPVQTEWGYVGVEDFEIGSLEWELFIRHSRLAELEADETPWYGASDEDEPKPMWFLS